MAGKKTIVLTLTLALIGLVDAACAIHVSLCNLDPNRPAKVVVELRGVKPQSMSGRVLTSPATNAHNTFENPDAVKPAAFQDFELKGGLITTTLPAKSVVVLEIKT